jgi:hypothetical protein
MDMHTRSANAERVHRTYIRRRSGTRVFSIKADEVALAEKLIEAGLLDPVLEDNCAAIEKAATQLIKIILSE